MLLGEPPRSQGDIHFRLFGFPVRIHPFFWIIAVLLGMNSPDVRQLLIWVVAVFISILWHEMGHAVVMRIYGFRPWITLYGMGGLASFGDPQSERARRFGSLDHILVSLAGPMAGFLLAALLVAVAVLTDRMVVGSVWPPYLIVGGVEDLTRSGPTVLTSLINSALAINIFWGIINLMPIYPLDGGQIARELFLLANTREGIRRSLVLSMISAGVVALFAAIQLHSFFMALLFGFMAYESYRALQAYSGRRGPW